MSISEFLAFHVFDSVSAGNLGKVPGVFLHVDFCTPQATLRIIGQAADLADRTEAFYLSASWLPNRQQSDSVSQESGGWGSTNIALSYPVDAVTFWKKPRLVQFYRDREDGSRGLKIQGPLESAAAIEFADPSSNGARLILLATADYPCSVAVIDDHEEGETVLAHLEKFTPKEGHPIAISI